MTVGIVLIIFAVVLGFLAFKFVKGLIKFGLLALIAIVVIYFLVKGGGLG
jgi:hypothetical protein